MTARLAVPDIGKVETVVVVVGAALFGYLLVRGVKGGLKLGGQAVQAIAQGSKEAFATVAQPLRDLTASPPAVTEKSQFHANDDGGQFAADLMAGRVSPDDLRRQAAYSSATGATGPVPDGVVFNPADGSVARFDPLGNRIY